MDSMPNWAAWASNLRFLQKQQVVDLLKEIKSSVKTLGTLFFFMLFHSKTATFQFPKSLRSPRFQLLIWVLDLQLLRQPFWGMGQPVRLSS